MKGYSRLRLAPAVLFALFTSCGTAEIPSNTYGHVETGTAPAALETDGVGVGRSDGEYFRPLLSGPMYGLTDIARDKKSKDADKPKDYWENIHFSLANFHEVREYVRTYYIDGSIDESRAFAEAANFALLEMKPARELLPADFYDARKDSNEEEGRLSGKVYRLSPDDPYVVHIIPNEKQLKAFRKAQNIKKTSAMSDDEIRQKRTALEVRRAALEAGWNQITFGEAAFERVLDHAVTSKSKEKIPQRKFLVAAAQGYLYSLDPHSSLVSAAAWDESTRNTTDSSFEGIGAILTQRDDFTIVESPIEGRPAFESGVRAGDRIIKVDGGDIRGLPLHKVVSKIRGKKGTVVKLTIVREGDPEERIFPIVRAHIDIKNVSGRLLEPYHSGIGYVKVTGFVPSTYDMLREQVRKLAEQHGDTNNGAPLRGLILDLRNNSGGLLQQGVKVADTFLRKGRIVEVKNRIRRNEVYRAHSDDTLDLPLIVLVNDGSASASEIVASAIQDNGRGLVVGDRTFGKASVQTLFTPILRKDFYIKLTIARYFSPSGRTIQVVGVRPDFDVPPDVGGKMPLGFREENLARYLKPIQASYKSPVADLAEQVSECADLLRTAEKVHANDPTPQIKYDYQLMKAADYMECYSDLLANGLARK
ncbi:MAG: S41 family peptidase [Myxococcota bacterium]|nr:S41 family peptidase [Myxococcota bacterium]